MRVFVLTVVLLISFSINAQENCTSRSEWWKDHKRFIPVDPAPIMTLRVNLVIPQKTDGTGNFIEADEEQIWVWDQVMKKVNKLYKNLKDPKDATCYPGDDFIPDTYFRFELNAIVYVQDDSLWRAENGSGCPRETNWWLNAIDRDLRADERYNNAINVYMPNNEAEYAKLIDGSIDEPSSTPPCSEMPTYKVLDRSSRINLAGVYNKYYHMKNVVPTHEGINKKGKPWEPTIKQWFYSTIGHTLAHEFGHSLGLGHANEYHGRNKCEFSLMNQRHNKPHNYVQPSEIGKMHRAIRMTNIQNFLVEDVYSPQPLIIDEDANIDLCHKSFEDIIVKTGATLTVSCSLNMPSMGTITVEPGAHLIIDGGVITGRADIATWKGIILQKESSCFLKSKKNRKSTGTFTLLNEGKLVGCTDPIVKKIKKNG